MKSFFNLGLIIVSLLKISYIIDADHCDNTDAPLEKPKDVNTSSEEPDNCSISYLAILNPSSNPLRDDNCKIRGFHLKNNIVGPSCIPEIGNLKKDEIFSINRQSHRKEAGLLLDVFLNCLTFEDFKSAALYYKSKVNYMLFSHVFNSAIINRDDTQAYSAPSLLQTQPELLFSNKLIQEANQKIKNDENKVLHEFIPHKRNFIKHDDHEKFKYERNEQIFDPAKNNKHFQKTPKKFPNSLSFIPPKTSLGGAPNIMGSPPSLMGVPKIMYSAPNLMENEPMIPSKLPFIPKPTEDNILILNPDKTGSDKNPEQRLSYFREDISINSHHSHWHQSYPMNLKKDRQGELFYYMHNQMIRRYDGARHAEGLSYVKPLEIKEAGTIIEEGYYPHLSNYAGSHYSGRSKHMTLRDVRFLNDESYMVNHVVECINAIKEGIKKKFLINVNKKKFKLDNEEGIDILGAVIESRQWSDENELKEKYGDIHNHGHILISNIHDANSEYFAPASVMSSTETALRDPVFWRWHKMVDNIFNFHKAELPKYKNEVLTWETVQIKNFIITTDNFKSKSSKPQKCYTYFYWRELDIGNGLDFSADNPIKVRMRHLDNLPFTYAINVNNKNAFNVLGHVRIFISPKYTEKNKLATEEELRQHAIEMDRFTIALQRGNNDIVRKSTESAVTMVPGFQWSQLSKNNVGFVPSSEGGGYCGCGWPSHLLLPKGNKIGIKYVAFVMISDWSKERVDSSTVERTCGDSLTMCGLRNMKFPDKRAMGFPLDRPFHGKKNWFHRANMMLKDITIIHYDNIDDY